VQLLEGARAIVTGGGSGIGRAVCQRFAAHGATVAVLDVDGAAAAAVAAEVDGASYAVDVTDAPALADALSAAVRDLGGVTVLVNNAGGSGLAGIDATTPQEWQRLVTLNLTSAFNGIRQIAPVMKRSGGGSIVSTASISGVRPAAGEAPYAAAKAGVIALTASAALEFAPSVRVNAVSPGAVHTRLTDPLLSHVPGAREEWERRTPLGRIGAPVDIADVVVFLCSDLARFMTGQNLVVDGGMLLHGSGVDGLLTSLT
jgi:NAD(P)-dependent dehydrogenase (short-subunit alcohol dehydrogenase family)